MFQKNFQRKTIIDDLSFDVLLIFQTSKNIFINKKYCVTKKQFSFCSTFVLTNYKIQKLTLNHEMLNLTHSFVDFVKHNRNIKKIMKQHKKFCFTYVQFFRFRDFENLRLLKSIIFQNVNNASHFLFVQKNERLMILNAQTQTR